MLKCGICDSWIVFKDKMTCEEIRTLKYHLLWSFKVHIQNLSLIILRKWIRIDVSKRLLIHNFMQYIVETKTVLWDKQNLKEIKSFLKLHNPTDINTNQVRPTHLLIPEPYIIWESQKAIKSTAIISHTFHTSSFQKKTPYYAKVKAMKSS